jgi:hypothetical protein
MTSTELDALVALGEGITPGPWSIDKCSCGHPTCSRLQPGPGLFYQGCGYDNEADARAIAAVPDLIAAIITLRKSEDELRHELTCARGSLKSANVLIEAMTGHASIAIEANIERISQALSNTEGGV